MSAGTAPSLATTFRLPPVAQVAAVQMLLLAVFWETATSMVRIWLRSETFTHAFLVIPITAWLIWRRRHDLAAQTPRAQPLWLLPMAAAAFLWLLGELAGVAPASQFALVSLVVLTVPALCGWGVARRILFPLLFLFFTVPFGEFAVPQLMDWTADFTVAALVATGIPVYREGLQFVIPSGNWSVIEACSGVRYMISSFMVGTLFAYLNYRSMWRRIVFAVVALVVPLVANWLRAYMIVMIGHLSGNELAVGVDHLIYGWVFFGIVIGLMFFIGARWSEPDAPPEARASAVGSGTANAGGNWFAMAGIALLAFGVQAWHGQLTRPQGLAAPQLALPAAPAGWTPATAPMPWPPSFKHPAAEASQAYERGDRRVWVWIGYYRQQDLRSKLISSANGIVPITENTDWQQADRGWRPAGSGLPAYRTVSIRKGHAMSAADEQRLRVWQAYWIGGRWTVSDARAKVWQAWDRLTGLGDDGAVVLFATQDAADADHVLEEFARAGAADIGAGLAATRDTR